MKKFTYVFVGQNASAGTPNAKTGRMSFFGTIYKFTNKKDALEFAEKRETGCASRKVEIGGRKKMRSLCLGQTMASFNEYLDCLQEDDVLYEA